MHQTVRTALTFFLIVSMTFQTSLGCWRTRSACCPPPCAATCSPCRPVCNPCGPVCSESVVVFERHPAPCESDVARPTDSNAPVAGGPTPTESPAAAEVPGRQPIAPTPAEDPVAEAPPIAPSPVVEPTPREFAPADDLRASEPVQPAHDVAPAERGFDTETSREPMPMPSEPEPATNDSSDLSDLFDDPNEAPAEEPRGAPESAPAEEAPAREAPAATDSIDDLFGDVPADAADADNEISSDESPEPVEEPVFDAEPQSADDEPVPSDESADSSSDLDDLFDLDSPSDQPGESDDEMPADDAPIEEEPQDDADDAAPAEEEAPADDSSDLDDLFSDAAPMTQQPGGLASDEMKSWRDNTGRYSVRGRLVKLLDGKARILKENGRTATVPLHRLCRADVAFVAAQAETASVATIGIELASQR